MGVVDDAVGDVLDVDNGSVDGRRPLAVPAGGFLVVADMVRMI